MIPMQHAALRLFTEVMDASGVAMMLVTTNNEL
jgi:hypothetical protein